MLVRVETSTSSPGPTPAATSARCNAVVPLEHETAYFASQNAANSVSNRSMYSPKTPDTALSRIALFTNSISAAPTCGFDTGIFMCSLARRDKRFGEAERVVFVLRTGARTLGEYQDLRIRDSLECVA